VDANDGSRETHFIRSHTRGEVRHRRFGSQLLAQLLARGFQLTALAADAARPGILSERVDHRAAHPPLGEGFELDPPGFVIAACGVDQADHAVLHEVGQLDRVRH
jgi:hypothetical protein